MAFELDPEGREPRALHSLAKFAGARVLEVGCGDGRLMARYAASTACSVGCDPAAEDRVAARDSSSAVRERVRFVRADALRLPFASRSFDIALLAWSL